MKSVKKFLKDSMTGADGQSFDIGRILWFQATQAYMLITVYAIYKGSYVFDPLLWGSGLAALAGGFGASIYAKAGTEPSSISITKGNVSFKQRFGKQSGSDDDDDSSPSSSSDDDDDSKDKDDDDNGGDDSNRSVPPPPPPPPKKK